MIPDLPIPELRCEKCGGRLESTNDRPTCLACALAAALDGPSDRPHTNPVLTPNSPPEPVLRRFGEYELIEEIARGGMGVVYRARHTGLGRIVAFKMVLFGQFTDSSTSERFCSEARVGARLRHPNIVPIHDFGTLDGQPWFTMDLIEGPNLGEALRQEVYPFHRAATLLKCIALAVHYAHSAGVLHRDLKPSNILLDSSGTPHLTDFGLARELSADSSLTLSGQALGSPNYMAPEQASNAREATAAADIWSLGAILYHFLTGRPPFGGATVADTVRAVRDDEPPSPRLLNASVPRDLETICLKCLEKKPAKRYPSAQDLADELDRFLRDEPILARPVSRAERSWRWCRRKPALAAALGLAALLLLVLNIGGPIVTWRLERAREAEAAARVHAERTATHLEMQRAEDLLDRNDDLHGVAHLARLVREQPSNTAAAQRLISALSLRNFCLPVGPPLLHDKKVNHAEFSPDGRFIGTAALDGTARLWDARTGEPVAPLLNHDSIGVRYLHFSPDGRHAVTVADGEPAQLWEIPSGQRVGQPLRHEKQILSAEFSPNGKFILTASADTTARLWHTPSGKPAGPHLAHPFTVLGARFSMDGRRIVTRAGNTAQIWTTDTGRPTGPPLAHRDTVSSAIFSPDGQRVVTASDDSTARIWDAATGESVGVPLTHRQRVAHAEFSPDGQRIVTASNDGTTRFWDARSGNPLAPPIEFGGMLATARFSPDGRQLAVGHPGNASHVRDAITGEPISAPLSHDYLIWSVRFSPDSRYIVSASADRSARVWDTMPGRVSSLPLEHGSKLWFAEFSPDGDWVVTASDNSARVWNTRDGRPRTPLLPHSGRVFRARFSPDGRRVITASHDGTARLWDAATGTPLGEPLRHDGGLVEGIEFSPDGQKLLTVAAFQGAMLWKATDGSFIRELIRAKVTRLGAFSPDGRRVALGNFDDDTVMLFDVDTGRQVLELRGHTGFPVEVRFSPDGRLLVSCGEDGTARIWDLATGQLRVLPLAHRALVDHAEFSPDGLRVLTASHDRTARIWDTATGQPLSEPLRHGGGLRVARFSRDGRRLATASDDGTARLWDVESGRPVTEPLRHGEQVIHVAFSRDGRSLLTASHDGTARIWELPPEPAFAEARLLADLAEAVTGQRLTADGTLAPASSERLGELRRQLAANPPATPFSRWLAWFLADRATRTISPESPITVSEFQERFPNQK